MYTDVYTYIYIYTHMCMYVCVYIYIYVHIHTSSTLEAPGLEELLEGHAVGAALLYNIIYYNII